MRLALADKGPRKKTERAGLSQVPPSCVQDLLSVDLTDGHHRKPLPNGGPHIPDIGKGWVGSRRPAVEDGLTVQYDFQTALAYWRKGYVQRAAKLCEELGRYPSGLWQVASSYAVGNLQAVLIIRHVVSSLVQSSAPEPAT